MDLLLVVMSSHLDTGQSRLIYVINLFVTQQSLILIQFVICASHIMLSLQSQPVEGFYCSRGKLLEFDLPGGIPESWPKLLQALNLEDHEDKQSAAA